LGCYIELKGAVSIMIFALNKNFLENRLDKQLRAINKQRAELDRQEEDAIATMLKEDQENKLLIGLFLEDAVKNTVGRPEVRSVESTNMLDAAHEGDEVDEDDEYENVMEPELSNGIDTSKSANL
jgi:hypothetical protein